MCGIAGWHSLDPLRIRSGTLDRMLRLLVHRGPDGSGSYRGDGIELGMRRLAVIDPAGSRQPVRNEDETVWAVCNGEIYNFRKLRKQLLASGHRFRTEGDVEPLVHLYEEHGIDFVHELRGMFAIALWDSQRRRLVLVRDRLGIKPLHYTRQNGALLFSSELCSLYSGLEHLPEVEPTALAQYLAFGYIVSPRSIYRHVYKLAPGHMLIVQEDRHTVRQYWELPVGEDTEISLTQATQRLQTLLDDAVSSHLVSDVPLGTLLSGGVDSSVVAGAVARVSSAPPDTFSVGFNQPAFDELRFARMMAQRLGTEHHEFSVEPNVLELLPSIVAHHGEPFGDPSALPTSVVSKMARRHVTVALSGDGGDELFAGYTRYLVDRRRRWVDSIPLALRGPVFRTLTRALPAGTYGMNLLRALAHDRTNRYLHDISAHLDPRSGGIASAELFDGIQWVDVVQPFLKAFERVRHRDFTTQLMYVDLQTYLPDDILTKVDRTSMMHSLEVRPPFLDHPLVEFAVSLPGSLKIDGGRTKKVLREAAGDMLPAVIGNRGKQGFAMPLAPWFKVDLRSELDRLARWEGPLSWSVDRDARRRMVTEHLRGRRDHSHILWRMLFLMAWEDWSRDLAKTRPAPRSILCEPRLG